jgi:hypothetical protein
MLGRVRTQLDLYDLDPDETITPPPLSALRDAVRVTNIIGQAARYESMTPVLPGLYAELHTAANTWTGTDAWGLLAEAYRCAHTVGIAAGYPDLSLIALNRMGWAARQAGDRAPALRAAREYLRITAYLRRPGWHLNNAGRSHLEGTDAKTPGALIAAGQLNLGAAVIAARTCDVSAVRDDLNEAERYADQTGEDLETFWFGFGPTNVAVHRIITMIELGDYSHAIHLGEFIQFARGWLPTRIGHHHFDLARAYQRMNLPDQAFRHLQLAHQVAPGQARRHPLVRGVVTDLLQPARQPSEALTRYAAWIGL